MSSAPSIVDAIDLKPAGFELAEQSLPEVSTAGELQEMAELASEICGTPISLVSLLDEKWQTILASVGLPVRRVRRDLTMCAHTLAKNDLMIVEDTMKDVRFAGHPMVTGDPEIRFYAGLPLADHTGKSIGSLCVVDLRPRTLTLTQERALRVLAGQFRSRLELRAEHRALEQALEERDRIAGKLHSNERLFQTFMNNGPLLSYMKDDQGRYVFYNSRMAERFLVTQTEWLGKTDLDLFPEQQARQFRDHDLEVLASRRLILSDETTCEDGQCITWRSYKFPCEDENGRQMVAGFSMDVTEELKRQAELVLAHRELEKVARADALTGLWTRRVFDEELEPAFERAQESKQTLSLMILDLDNFNQRNTRLGRDAGDAALATFGTVLNQCLSPGDTGVRYGGAEFAILMPETTAEEAKSLAEQVQAKVRAVDWGAVGLTLSIGIATTRHAIRSGRQLFCFADDAMYQAKNAGKNRVILYRPR